MSAQKIFGRSWEEIPLPLQLYFALSVLAVPIAVVHTLAGGHPLAAALSPLGPVIVALLLRGWRWLWVVLVFGSVLALALPPYHYNLSAWLLYINGFTALDTVLLLWPSTFRYFWRRPPKLTATQAGG